MKNRSLLTAFCIVLYFTACTFEHQEKAPTPTPVRCQSPDTVSFAGDIAPVLNQNCNIPACHSGSAPEGNLNLEASKAYTALNKRGSGYIDTVRPKMSVLYSSLVSKSQPMPPTGNLDSCTIKLFEIWMKQGGKNN